MYWHDPSFPAHAHNGSDSRANSGTAGTLLHPRMTAARAGTWAGSVSTPASLHRRCTTASLPAQAHARPHQAAHPLYVVAWSIAQLSDHSAVTAAGDTAPLLSWQRICAGCWQRGYAGCRERGHDQGHSSGERADRVHLVTLSSPRPQVVVACSQRAPQSHSWRVLLMCASPHVLNYEQSCLTPAAGLREKQAPQQAPQRRLRASCRAG